MLLPNRRVLSQNGVRGEMGSELLKDLGWGGMSFMP